jgi:hypothetical protein
MVTSRSLVSRSALKVPTCVWTSKVATRSTAPVGFRAGADVVRRLFYSFLDERVLGGLALGDLGSVDVTGLVGHVLVAEVHVALLVWFWMLNEPSRRRRSLPAGQEFCWGGCGDGFAAARSARWASRRVLGS